jgi:hypothetical protein
MSRQTRTFLLIAALFVLAAAALLFLDVQVSRANLSADWQAARHAANMDSDHPLPAEQALDLYVLGPERLKPALARQLTEALQSNPYIGAVTLREGPPQAAAGSILVVRVEEPANCLWTPFYTKTGVGIEVAYASDGVVDWIEADSVVFAASEPPQTVARVEASLDLDGSGYGLISRPAYYDYLAGEITRQLGSLLQTQLNAGSG